MEAQYDSQMKKRSFRPDLTDYLPYIEALTDRLNDESIFKMSRTDAAKIAIELACKNGLEKAEVVPNIKNLMYIPSN